MLKIFKKSPSLAGMVTVSLECLYASEAVQIDLDKVNSLIQLTFRQQPESEQFRNGYRLAIDAALAKEVKYWLTDATRIKAMLPENQNWLVQQMAPLLKTFSIRKFAIVMAPECFVMTNPNKVYEKPVQADAAPSSGSIKVHFDKDSALQWLFSEMDPFKV